METLRGDFTLPYLTLYCKKGNTDGDTEEGGGDFTPSYPTLYCKKGNTDGDTEGGTSHHPTLHCTVRRAILMETLKRGGGGGLHTILPYIVL